MWLFFAFVFLSVFFRLSLFLLFSIIPYSSIAPNCPSLTEKKIINFIIWLRENIAKFVNWSHEKNLEICQSIACKNLKIFQTKTGSKIMNYFNMSLEETTKLTNLPWKLLQNLIFSHGKKYLQNLFLSNEVKNH